MPFKKLCTMKFFKLFSKIIFFTFCITTLNAQITVGSMIVGQGVTTPNAWQNYQNAGIFVDVNTSACGFQTTPHYLVTLESINNSGYHWAISGTPAIYNPTPTGFRVYLRWTDHPTEEPTIGGLNYPNPLRRTAAINRGWVIRWTGIVTGDCATCDNQNAFRNIDNSEVEGSPSEINVTTPILHTEKQVKIFPNPTSTIIKVESSDKVTKCEIYNLSGQLLKTTTNNSVDIKNLPDNDYLIKVYFGDEFVTKKFVKME